MARLGTAFSIVVIMSVLGSVGGAFAERAIVARGELRVFDKCACQWAYITFNVFEHLIEHDADGKAVPGLATSWRWIDDVTLEVKLRRGVRFHNGEVFDAEVVKLNLDETGQLRHPFHLGNFLSFERGTHMEVLDRYTLRIHLPKPDGAALARLSYIHIGSREFYQAGGWGAKHW